MRRRVMTGIAALGAAPWLRAGPGPLRFGVPPWQKDLTGDDMRAYYRPMLDELSARLGQRMLLVDAHDYGEIIELLSDGRIDIATISPGPYVLARKRNPGITMILTELSWNADHTAKHDYYLGHIVTLKSRDTINAIEDLKGRPFAFVARESTSGFIVPKNMLAHRGIRWETYFSKAYFLGSHPRVTDALVAGSVEGAATWEYNLAQATEKHGDVFKVLLTSDRIPNLGIAVHPSVSAEQRRIIQRTLTQIDPAKLKGMSAVGYVMRPPESYDRIARLLE
jgi:phosphonate transport system substrate-binding protein